MTDEVTIITQPQNQTIPVAGTALFTVEAMSPSTINYKWYKVGEEQYTLSNTDTLTWDNVQFGDEGYYCCDLTNDIGTVVTEPARLMTERLVGWWKLNGDALDSVGEVVPGAPAHDGVLPAEPNFIVDGIDEQGYEFFGDGRVIVMPTTGEYFNFHR